MVPLGLYPVLAATVKLILTHMITVESLGIVLVSGSPYSRDEVADEQLFNSSSSRERSDVRCPQGHYLHPNQPHCCIQCHKGTYVAQHCESQDKTTTCAECPTNAYMPSANSAEKCRPCQLCYAALKQVALSSCSSVQDIVCGCAEGQYRTDDSPEFRCKPCSACHNGTVWKTCTSSSDTICMCHKGFFLQTNKNSCSPCDSCRGKECKECDVVSPGTSPPDSPDMTPILATLVVIFGFAILLLAGKVILRKPLRKELVSVLSGCATQGEQPSDEVQATQPEVQGTSIRQEPNQNEMLLPPPTAVPAPSNTQGLPDCIQSAGETQIPDCPTVLYTVVDHVPFPQWKEFVRRLGLTDNTIGRIEAEERNMRDAQYKMLRHWRLQLGQRATVERISGVLKEMELSGCSEAIQDILSFRPQERGASERGLPMHTFLS